MSAGAVTYLDHNATTPLADEAIVAMVAALRETYGNPSSPHAMGQAAKALVSEARAEVAQLVGAMPAEIVFTSGATESNQLAVRGTLAASPDRRHLVLSAVEHPSLLHLAHALEREGVAVSWIPVDVAGRIDPDQVAAAIRPDTALVSVMWANNETGVIAPIAQIATIARAAGVPFHCDATQAAARIPVDLGSIGVDLASLSAHKLNGPKGVGALFVRKGGRLQSVISGSQERGRRGGTENVPGIAGFGAAARVARLSVAAESSRLAALRDEFEANLAMRIAGVSINGGEAPRLPNTSNLRFPVVDAEALLIRLDRAGICVSTGSACSAGGTEPSHVLLAMGQTRQQAQAALRVSLGRGSTHAHLAQLLDALAAMLAPAQERAA